jgi:hypothetical protein
MPQLGHPAVVERLGEQDIGVDTSNLGDRTGLRRAAGAPPIERVIVWHRRRHG